MTIDILTQAFRQVPRRLFLPARMQRYADQDRALPIGYGQTNSQPSTVRRMLEWLHVEPGQKVLDVGSGSGWTTALLARLVGPTGRVWGVERVPELVDFGRDNCDALGVRNVTFVKSGKIFGLPAEAPFDRILVSAESSELPQELMLQLKPSGLMVVPVHDDVLEVQKRKNEKVHIETHHGFVFVPLVHAY